MQPPPARGTTTNHHQTPPPIRPQSLHFSHSCSSTFFLVAHPPPPDHILCPVCLLYICFSVSVLLHPRTLVHHCGSRRSESDRTFKSNPPRKMSSEVLLTNPMLPLPPSHHLNHQQHCTVTAFVSLRGTFFQLH